MSVYWLPYLIVIFGYLWLLVLSDESATKGKKTEWRIGRPRTKSGKRPIGPDRGY